MHIGALVRAAREIKGMERSDLAKALGLTWQAVHRIERMPTMKVHRLLQIQKILGGPLIHELAIADLPTHEQDLLDALRTIPPKSQKAMARELTSRLDQWLLDGLKAGWLAVTKTKP